MDKEIRDLIYQTVDKTISQSDFDRLQNAMLEDAEVQKEYLRAVNVFDILADPTAIRTDTSKVETPKPTFGLHRVVGIQRTIAKAAMVVAATLLVTLTLQSYTGSRDKVAVVLPAQSVTNQKVEFDHGLAQIIQRIDCVLDTEKWGVRAPEKFHPGESVAISKGLLVVEFNSGVVVTLEGPADLEIQTSNSCYLHSGRLSAIAPDDAFGFEIITPSTRVVDHGSEFGVKVDASGNTEVHMFAGDAELMPTRRTANRGRMLTATSSPAPESVTLGSLSAARVMSKRTTPNESWMEWITADHTSFVQVPNGHNKAFSPASVTNLPTPENLILWFEASQGVQRDSRSRVISWDNLASTISDKHQTNTAAWQVTPDERPLWKPNTYPILSHPRGWPSLQFEGRKGREFLVTSPIEFGDDFTVFAVCSMRGGKSGALLSLQSQTKIRLTQSGDSPKINVSATTTKDSAESTFQRHLIKSEAQLPEMLVLCAVQYSYEKDTFELYIDGRIQGTGTPLAGSTEKRSHVIGTNGSLSKLFYTGNIAEIAVYDHMLDQDAFSKATESFIQKYELSLR
ncbi:hypothetical protein FHS27_001751 [Rhodopirellula rubra]|uniref:FecR protein n=1 Tax=Aporhodopirellula rubra TaxID=980271 RepID=A0A7W5H574_9BACT|nr:iron dicitrate transport regulator FecR [Aporhodopirellula rubra]MBB3205943.1 hypothetical protein [Aporhodopirellula rubra]